LSRRQSPHAATGPQFEADLSFDFGSVIGEVDPPQPTALSLLREWAAGGYGFANSMLDAQSRRLKPA
jgi:hypothetical protein